MWSIEGQVAELGDSVTQTNGSIAVTRYSFIRVGERTLRKIKINSGLRGKLEQAFERCEPVTLHIQNGIICAIGVGGELFASDMENEIGLTIFALLCVIVGLITLPIVVGAFFLYFAWTVAVRLFAQRAGKNLPGAVPI